MIDFHVGLPTSPATALSRMSRHPSSPRSLRPTPTTHVDGSRRPSCARASNAGSSLRDARSPLAPKMTMAAGGAGFALISTQQRGLPLEGGAQLVERLGEGRHALVLEHA